MPTYRIIQWATGNVGHHALRMIVERPDFELVGLRVYDPAKRGKDAGELLGIGPVGVKATDDPAQILALDADCVCYTPLGPRWTPPRVRSTISARSWRLASTSSRARWSVTPILGRVRTSRVAVAMPISGSRWPARRQSVLLPRRDQPRLCDGGVAADALSGLPPHRFADGDRSR